MSNPEKIKNAFERYAAILNKRPEKGRETNIARAETSSGLTCTVTAGDWTFTADMPVAIGGNNAGPTPGVYSRFALASCLVIGYMSRAALFEVPIAGIHVEVQADADDCPAFTDMIEIAHYSEFRYIVHVESPASEADIMRVLDEGDAHSPILSLFEKPQTLKRTVRITQPQD